MLGWLTQSRVDAMKARVGRNSVSVLRRMNARVDSMYSFLRKRGQPGKVGTAHIYSFPL